MNTLGANDEVLSNYGPNFIARQFGPNGTEPQLIFDIILGVVAPILCFYFDPTILKGGILGPPLYGHYQLLAYAVSLIQIPVLATWLIFGRHLHSFSAPIGGVLIAGSIFSFLVGVFILPYTVMGLLVVVGFLGFTPFLTGFIYLRNGCRALRLQSRNAAYPSRFLTAFVAAILSISLPLLINHFTLLTVSRSVDVLLHGDTEQMESAVNQIRWLPFIPQESTDQIVEAYRSGNDLARKELLRKYFRQLTGEDIDHRVILLDD